MCFPLLKKYTCHFYRIPYILGKVEIPFNRFSTRFLFSFLTGILEYDLISGNAWDKTGKKCAKLDCSDIWEWHRRYVSNILSTNTICDSWNVSHRFWLHLRYMTTSNFQWWSYSNTIYDFLWKQHSPNISRLNAWVKHQHCHTSI